MRNRYKVTQRKWRRWSDVARGVFNRTYSTMKENPSLFRHPKDPVRSNSWGRTTAWNAAWIAADNVDETLKEMANA